MSRQSGCTKKVCVDGKGFYARPCACGRQKPLNERTAAIYQWPVETMMTAPMLKDSLRLRYPDQVVR